jgi:hypothetical protein
MLRAMSILAHLSQRLRSLSRDQLLIAGAIMTLVSYAMLYIAYFQFYASFGLRPGDVGLTRVRLLQESTVALVVLPLGRLMMHWRWVAAGLTVTGVAAVVALARRKCQGRVLLLRLVEVQVTAFLLTLLILAIVGYVAMVYEARSLGAAVGGEGKLISGWVTNTRGLYLPNLDVQALPVDIIRPADAPPLKFQPECTLYLGQSDSYAVLFDVRQEKVIRLPLDGLTLVTYPGMKPYPGEQLPPACASNEGNDIRPAPGG